MTKSFLSSACVLIVSFLFTSLVLAQTDIPDKKVLSALEILQSITKKRVYLKTKTVRPLNIAIYPFAGNYPRKISGEIAIKGKVIEPEKVVFYLETKYKETLWRKELLWRERFDRTEGAKIPFVFDLPERNVEAGLRLRAEILGSYQKVIAEGIEIVNLPSVDVDALAFSSVSKLLIAKGKTLTRGSFVFDNKSLSAPMKAQITVQPDTLSQTESQSFWVDMSDVALGATQKVEFNFPTPAQSQLYKVGVQVFTEDDIPLSGVLESNFLVEGLFAEVINFDFEPKDFWSKNAAVRIDFSGEISDAAVQTLQVRTQIFSHDASSEAGEGLATLVSEQTQGLTVNRYRQFTETVEFVAPWGLEQLRGTMEFIIKGKVIGTFDFTTPVFPAPNTTIAERFISTITAPLANNKSLSVGQKVLVMLAIVILLGLLIWGIVFMVRKGRAKNLILFILLLPLIDASAINRHFEHFSVEVYSSSIAPAYVAPAVSLTIGEEFLRLIPFRGTADSDATGGKFVINESTQVFAYILPVTTDTPTDADGEVSDDAALDAAGAILLSTEGTEAAIADFIPENKSDYFYEVDASIADLAEVEYKLVRMFYNSQTMPNMIVIDMQINSEYRFKIDKTAPPVVFSVRNPITTTVLKDPAYFLAMPEADKTAALAAEYFVNGPVEVKVDCNNDCVEQDSAFDVLGNFCADPTKCDAVGTRSFRVCDDVMNCGDTELNLTHFDGAPPSFTNFELSLQGTTIKRAGGSTVALKTDEDYIFSIEGSAEETTIPSADVDSDACGGVATVAADVFFNDLDTGTCHAKEFSCATSSTKRGTVTVTDSTGAIDPLDRSCDASCDLTVFHSLQLSGTTSFDSPLKAYYCGADDLNHPDNNNGIAGPKNCCLPACKFKFPYCFPLPFY